MHAPVAKQNKTIHIPILSMVYPQIMIVIPKRWSLVFFFPAIHSFCQIFLIYTGLYIIVTTFFEFLEVGLYLSCEIVNYPSPLPRLHCSCRPRTTAPLSPFHACIFPLIQIQTINTKKKMINCRSEKGIAFFFWFEKDTVVAVCLHWLGRESHRRRRCRRNVGCGCVDTVGLEGRVVAVVLPLSLVSFDVVAVVVAVVSPPLVLDSDGAVCLLLVINFPPVENYLASFPIVRLHLQTSKLEIPKQCLKYQCLTSSGPQ